MRTGVGNKLLDVVFSSTIEREQTDRSGVPVCLEVEYLVWYVEWIGIV